MRYILLFLWISNSLQAQTKIDLYEWHHQNKLSYKNRSVEGVIEGKNRFIQVAEKSGEEGIVWIPVDDFKNGSLEIEMRGKDVLQKSFIGLLFHAVNDSTYDAVYCRPFNFMATDEVRRIHAIQYISHPIYTWKKLRDERNGVFENAIISPPDPNGWFTLKVIINDQTVSAFINDATSPSLSIEKIPLAQKGRIGIFIGAGSGGDFKRLTIRYE